MTSKYPELDGLKGVEYRKAWNRLHVDKVAAAQRKYRENHPEMLRVCRRRAHELHILRHGMARTSLSNQVSREKATQSYERWTSRDDAKLMRGGMTMKQCAEQLGRSLRAVMNRKLRLRNSSL